jgi:hypothetical protein
MHKKIPAFSWEKEGEKGDSRLILMQQAPCQLFFIIKTIA